MNRRLPPWPKGLVQRIIDNPEFVKIYVIPGLLFALDFTLRAVLGVDLIDAGADMALLAVATFMSLLAEENRQRYALIAIVFIVVFLALWTICLKIVSIKDPVTVSFLAWIDFRLVLSWFVGIISFVFSGIISNVVIRGTNN